MTIFEFRAGRPFADPYLGDIVMGDYGGFVTFDGPATIIDAANRILDLGFADITYLARAAALEPGAPVWPTPHGTATARKEGTR